MEYKKFDYDQLKAICNILGDTNEGLTGSEIKEALSQLNIVYIPEGNNKASYLFHSLKWRQELDLNGSGTIKFIEKCMTPIRYIGNHSLHNSRLEKLNIALSLLGLKLEENGKIQYIEKAESLKEAMDKANRLKRKLEERNVHIDVLKFCRAELVNDNYFHAVFEATKSVADKIRDKTGLTKDGAELVSLAFGSESPLLKINNLSSETEKSEQRGFANLLRGLFGTFRNVPAHAPKIKWAIEEEDALDLLSLVSYIHRKLDATMSFMKE
ncbi:MAG: TIGR02391 family protein [Nanoarchaeota archaeon]|nr:TIGR02391 family protein [Nanoarchaeota archaeon]